MLIVTDLNRGGTPLRLARLAPALTEAGIDVSVGCLAPPGPVSGDLEARGIATFACDARGAWDVSAIGRLIGHVQRLRPHVVHATLTHANVAARLVGAVLGVPVVGSTATIEVERRWHRWAERATVRCELGHVVSGQALAEHVVRVFRVPRTRVFVVPPFVPLETEPVAQRTSRTALGLSADERIVLWAGRFDPVKRLDIVVDCAERMPGVRFVLVGDGPQRPAVETRLRSGPAADRVDLPGWRDDLTLWLAAADVFLFPSLTEGMPNALLHAMAAGLPIVARDIPATRELAGGGPVTGPGAASERRLELIAGARAEDYVARLNMLLGNRPQAAALGRRAAEWARANLDRERTVEALLAVYRQCARGGAKAR